MPDETSNIFYDKIISENEEKGFQVRLTLSEFRGVTYLGLRKYFLSFDDGFVPSKEGISIPYEMSSSFALLDAMVDLCSDNEGIDAVKSRVESNT